MFATMLMSMALSASPVAATAPLNPAISQLEALREREGDHADILVNLGAAYAEAGRTQDARAVYRAVLMNREQVELKTVDGRWVDARDIARNALDRLDTQSTLAMR